MLLSINMSVCYSKNEFQLLELTLQQTSIFKQLVCHLFSEVAMSIVAIVTPWSYFKSCCLIYRLQCFSGGWTNEQLLEIWKYATNSTEIMLWLIVCVVTECPTRMIRKFAGNIRTVYPLTYSAIPLCRYWLFFNWVEIGK